jgi:hypothetical protein
MCNDKASNVVIYSSNAIFMSMYTRINVKDLYCFTLDDADSRENSENTFIVCTKTRLFKIKFD